MSNKPMIDKDNTASIDVDCQKGFTPLCPDELPVPDGHSIVGELNAQAELACIRVCSKDWHSENALWVTTPEHPMLSRIDNKPNLDVYWNRHCIAGTRGAELLDGLSEDTYDFVVYKGMEIDKHPYGACYHDLAEKKSTGLIEFLKFNKIDHVIVGGLALDYCVITTAIQLSKHFLVTVNLKACRAIDPLWPQATKKFPHTIDFCYDAQRIKYSKWYQIFKMENEGN